MPFLHWLNTELWGPLWPNVMAPSAWTLAAVIGTHLRAARQRERQHREMKEHVAALAAAKGESEGR